MYDGKDQVIDCLKGSIRLVENHETELVYNDAFLPELMVYDDNYQNEQAIFQRYLAKVATAISRSILMIVSDMNRISTLGWRATNELTEITGLGLNNEF
jgi:hypothetical protein